MIRIPSTPTPGLGEANWPVVNKRPDIGAGTKPDDFATEIKRHLDDGSDQMAQPQGRDTQATSAFGDIASTGASILRAGIRPHGSPVELADAPEATDQEEAAPKLPVEGVRDHRPPVELGTDEVEADEGTDASAVAKGVRPHSPPADPSPDVSPTEATDAASDTPVTAKGLGTGIRDHQPPSVTATVIAPDAWLSASASRRLVQTIQLEAEKAAGDTSGRHFSTVG